MTECINNLFVDPYVDRVKALVISAKQGPLRGNSLTTSPSLSPRPKPINRQQTIRDRVRPPQMVQHAHCSHMDGPGQPPHAAHPMASIKGANDEAQSQAR
jgi:hypothetical protein